MKNYYEILEVNKKASAEVIDKAYKVLVKKYHPDTKSTSRREFYEDKIKEINEAYEVLSNRFLKEQYDRELEKEELKLYEEKYKIKQEEQKEASKNQKKNLNVQDNEYKSAKIGSFASMIELAKEIIKNKPKREEIKKMTQKDIFAILLTILIIIIIGIVLWFIPFTNGWMRELLFENPLFNWIGGLFSK